MIRIVSGIAYFILSLYFLLFLYFLNSGLYIENSCSRDNNEFIQDWFEHNLGIEKTTEKVLSGNSINSTFIDGININSEKYFLSFNRDGRGYSGYIEKGINNARSSNITGNSFEFIWNNDIYGSFQKGFSVVKEWNITVYIIIIIPLVFLCTIYLSGIILLFLGKRKNINKYIIVVKDFSYIIIIISILWIIQISIYTPHWRNYDDSYQETEKNLKENIHLLRNLLINSDKTTLYEAEFLRELKIKPNYKNLLEQYYYPIKIQEKNIHNGKIFISKRPFFPYDYIRVNVDLCNTIFYAPKLSKKEFKEINRFMTFTALDNDLWLGQYKMYIDTIHKVVYSYLCANILYGIMFISSVIFIIFYKKIEHP